MNLLLRLALVFLGSLFKKRIRGVDESVLRMRVLPTDLDVNLHLNNGRYASIMDLGRLDLVLRSGLARACLRQKWVPLVGSSFIRFRRSLHLFQSYELLTRPLYWDQKWFYLEQRFVRKGKVVAIGYSRTLFWSKSGPVPPAEALKQVGISEASPEASALIQDWAKFESDLGV